MQINKEFVQDFYEDMKKKYKATYVHKDKSSTMSIVAWFLDKMGILDKKAFLNNFTTTINKTIYHPFTIGEGDEDELWSQIKTLVHEVIHIEQGREEGFTRYAYDYLFDKDKRARYEAEAYRSGMVLDWGRFKMFVEPKNIAEKLYSYGLEKKHVEFAEEFLKKSIPSIKAGAIFHEVVLYSLQYLELENSYKK